MKMAMFVLTVFMMLGVLHFAEETMAAPQEMERSGNEVAEGNQELAQRRSEEGEEPARAVEMRERDEEEDVGDAEDDADGPMDEVEGRNQQSASNARGFITGPRIVVGAFRKVFKKPSDS